MAGVAANWLSSGIKLRRVPRFIRVARWSILYQKALFWSILEIPGMENFGIFYSHLECLLFIWHILWSFGIFCGNLVYFVARPVGM
jgi:hypothetical protein